MPPKRRAAERETESGKSASTCTLAGARNGIARDKVYYYKGVRPAEGEAAAPPAATDGACATKTNHNSRVA